MADRIVISSFHHNILSLIKQKAPNLKTGLLFPQGQFPSSTDYAIQMNADAVHPNYRNVTISRLKHYHLESIKLNAYTVDKAEDIKFLASIGVDGIITNVPAKAIKILAKGRCYCPIRNLLKRSH